MPDLPRGARIGVDVGKARIGLAGSDPDGLVATPVETVPRVADVPRGADGAPSVTADVARIAAEVSDRFAAVVYVGLPRHLSGNEGAATADAREFAGRLARVVAPVPVHLVDERMTTVSAHANLRAAGKRTSRHRSVIDQAAAVIILQHALDAERVSGDRIGELVETR
ncbi:putative Holliday junction resolvase [Isoptericola jiangsuensis]|uniref:Putative pre-16S rRNA nuclease n=1 Tax=Isoptericola jiangsuensis TaxID=548579 RepID=A0A2A9EYH3_9MICO|nr:Holliday junction resolvase RuvX [Isoptericola jiangsuensis]PFG43275.1 putative Holliday junction resolvase [Isoptericola jiangsuensis]